VTCLGRICGSCYSCTKIQCNGCNLVTTIGIESDGVLVDLPRCCDGHILRRHSCGNSNIPICKGIAGLGGICGSYYCCSEIQCNGCYFATAIGIEGNGVLIDCPCCLNRYVFGGHSCGNINFPTCKGIAGLGRSVGSCYSCAEIQFDGSYFATAIGIEGDGVLLNCPRCRDSYVFGRHGCRNFPIPTCKEVTNLSGGCGSCYCRTEIQRDRSDLATAVGIESNGVLINSPQCLDGDTLNGHGCRDFFIPTGKGVAGLGGSCGSCYCCAEIQSDGIYFATAIGIEGNRVLINGPQCLNGDTLNRHGCRDFFIPTGKGVACLSRSCGSCYCCSKIQCDRSDLATAIGIEGNGVLINSPQCLNSHTLNRHCCGNFLIPTCKGITLFGGSCGSCYCCAEIRCNGGNLATAVGIEGNRVLIYSPYCLQGDVTGYSSCKIINCFTKIPTGKGITCLDGISGSNRGFAVLYGCSGAFGAIVGIKGYGVSIKSPFCL